VYFRLYITYTFIIITADWILGGSQLTNTKTLIVMWYILLGIYIICIMYILYTDMITEISILYYTIRSMVVQFLYT